MDDLLAEFIAESRDMLEARSAGSASQATISPTARGSMPSSASSTR